MECALRWKKPYETESTIYELKKPTNEPRTLRTHMIYLPIRGYLCDVIFHVLIIPQIVNDVMLILCPEKRKIWTRNGNKGADDDNGDQNVLDCDIII